MNNTNKPSWLFPFLVIYQSYFKFFKLFLCEDISLAVWDAGLDQEGKMPGKRENGVRGRHVSICYLLFTIIFVAFLSSCASSSPAPDASQSQYGTPPVEGRNPTEYTKESANLPERPSWIDATPEDKDGLHFLVGLSEHHASERGAREDAMRHARGAYANYTGVEVAIVDEVIQALYGKSSDILDATIGQKSKSTHSTDAKVSRIKAKQWYWEKYRATVQGEYRGTVYKYWVLVTVPVDEYDRVQAWKKQRDEALRLAEAAKENSAENALQVNRDRVKDILNRARTESASGNLVQALNTVQLGWNHLYTEAKRFEQGDQYYQARAGEIEKLQGTLVSEIGSMISALYIDSGRFGSQVLSYGGERTLVKVWVWSRKGSEPVSIKGLPLKFTDETGNVLARAVTGPSGRADFHLTAVSPGQFKIAVDTAAGTLGLLRQEIIEAISRVENRVALVKYDADMNGSTRNAVKVLFSGPALAPLPVDKLLMGPVTYGTTLQGSSFGHALQQVIRQQLVTVEGLTVVEPRRRSVQTVENAVKTRGISAQEKQPSLGTAAMQAVIDGAQAALEVSYTVQGYEVWVEMFLKQAGTDVLQGAATAVIDRNSIPPGLQLIPSQASTVSAIESGAEHGIKLDVTSHLGDAQTYQEGDAISFFVSTDKDAYLLLIYEDVEHHLIQTLPNKYSGEVFYKAGNYIELPGPADQFEFVIQGPFGLERLWAFAASVPFPHLKGLDLENGLVLLSDTMDDILKKLRNHGERPGVSYGEARTMITTVAKQ